MIFVLNIESTWSIINFLRHNVVVISDIEILILNKEVSGQIMFIINIVQLNKVSWLRLLTEVNGVTINDHVLSKVSVSSKTVVVRDRWLVN